MNINNQLKNNNQLPNNNNQTNSKSGICNLVIGYSLSLGT
jgi:hypothetical protein